MGIYVPERELPPEYQTEDVNYVLNEVLLPGESCSLIGIGSVGKSNLLRHIHRYEVKQYYLGQQADFLVTVFLDPHQLLHLQGDALARTGTLWPGYELLLNGLWRGLYELSEKTGRLDKDSRHMEIMARLKELRNRIYSPDPVAAQSGLRHLEKSVYEIYHSDRRWQIAFLIDEIEEFKKLPPEFFQSLRGLRDNFKGHVMFVTTSRTEIDEMMIHNADFEKQHVLESFVELFHAHIHYISPLSQECARIAVKHYVEQQRYADLYDTKVRDPFADALWQVSGGHVGLIRRGFKPAAQFWRASRQGLVSISFEDTMLSDAGIQKECQILIKSLTDVERQVLHHMITKQEWLDESVWQKLLAKHFVKEENGKPEFQSPLLGHLILQNPSMLVSRTGEPLGFSNLPK